MEERWEVLPQEKVQEIAEADKTRLSGRRVGGKKLKIHSSTATGEVIEENEEQGQGSGRKKECQGENGGFWSTCFSAV